MPVISYQEQVTYKWDDDDICFILRPTHSLIFIVQAEFHR